MDIYLILTLIITVVSLIVYYVFFSASIFDFFKNLFPEIIGIFVTYRIIEYLISRRKNREDERRLTNLYQQIRRELILIIMHLGHISQNVEYIDDFFYRWVKNNLKSVNVVYHLLIAGNDLFSKNFYATLFRVIRDIERNMDYVLDSYPSNKIYTIIEADKKKVKLSHDELANFIMHCEYEENPPKFELFQDQPKN